MEESTLDPAALRALPEDALEAKLYAAASTAPARPLPDFCKVHAEYRRVGVTLSLLHLEYLEQCPGGYGYTQFTEFYRRWLGQRGLTMRQEHKAGEKLYVDYSSKRPHYIDRETGQAVEVELFTAALGPSNLTYAEATHTQQLPGWIGSHGRAFAFIEGVPLALVPDQLKSGVTTACRRREAERTFYGSVPQRCRPSPRFRRPRRSQDA